MLSFTSKYSRYFLKTKSLINTFERSVQGNGLKRSVILGIETSCDDTGCAVVDSDGCILGEALHSQQQIHINFGGIIPPIAQNLHREHIEQVCNKAIEAANVDYSEIDAIATTVKPGLPLSLIIGLKYGKHLCKTYNKPLIPIHHMEAHALTARMIDPTVHFPFLVLLISGGHCLIAVAEKVDKFLLLGQSLDDAPGEAFDKAARRLKLRNIPEFSKLSGGQAIELAASKADNPLEFRFTVPLLHYKDCNFSLAGIKNCLHRHIVRLERLHGINGDEIIPEVYNLCASFQLTIAKHLCHRVQRAMEYINEKEILPLNNQTLVVSGGAACNNFISKCLQLVCDEMGYKFVRPPPKLCTDNGVMIAWNGIERWKANAGITTDYDLVDIEKSCPLGLNYIEDVSNSKIKCNWIKIKT